MRRTVRRLACRTSAAMRTMRMTPMTIPAMTPASSITVKPTILAVSERQEPKNAVSEPEEDVAVVEEDENVREEVAAVDEDNVLPLVVVDVTVDVGSSEEAGSRQLFASSFASASFLERIFISEPGTNVTRLPGTKRRLCKYERECRL
jgi:hypothetical protein